MVALGVMYEKGQGGLPKDDAQAVSWYRKAADAGEGSGMAYLGDMYENGRGGLPKDNAQAVSLYRMAADAGNTYAQKALKRLGH
jgi:TPR repeat protein